MADTGPSPIGIEAALQYASDPSFVPRPTLLQKEFSLDGRVAVVTGGHRGLGLEMAEALAEAGATVHCLGTSTTPSEAWKATATYVSKLRLGDNVRLEYSSVDVSDQSAIRGIIDEIAKKEGRLDICVANAGINKDIPCLDISHDEFERIMVVNANGTFYTAQAAARQMVRLGIPGSIILTTSIAGSGAIPNRQVVPYSASKGAGTQMVKSLACELAQYRIRVNSLSPGVIPTEINQHHFDANPQLLEKIESRIPLGRVGKPAELRGAVVWLASDASSFCNGSDIIIDGGQRAW